MIKIMTCFLLGCAVLTLANRKKRILYGRKVGAGFELRNQFPGVLYIEVCDSKECNYCTGTLVKVDRVLLAANCFCMLTDEVPTVTIWGNSVHKKAGIKTTGYRLFTGLLPYDCSAKPTNSLCHDIALVHLYKPLGEILPMSIFCKVPTTSMNIAMVGFGFDEKNNRGRLKVAFGITTACPEKWRKYHPICVRGGGRVPRPTAGDNGGPLLVRVNGRYFTIGVSSAEIRYYDAAYHGFENMVVWNSIYDYCGWIENSNDTHYYAYKTSTGQRSTVGVTEVMIQSFVALIVLNF